jgi:RNA polymerase sigma factor (sigma-70 family)
MLRSGQLRELIGRLRQLVPPPEGGAITDAELVGRFARLRDETAFELLIWRHGGMVLGVCRRLLRHEQDTEDAFQATFLALARKAGSISRREATASWLYRVAYRVALRAKARMVSFEPLPVDQPAPAAEGDFEWRDLRPVLDEELNRLPEKLRAAVVLCYLEGLTTEQAARQLRCPKGTVLSRLSRARERLGRRLGRRGITLSVATLGAALSETTASASVPLALVDGTIKASFMYAAGHVPAGAIAVHIPSLTEGVLKAMFLTKLKIALAVVLLATGLVGAGVGLYGPALQGAEQSGANKNAQANQFAAAKLADHPAAAKQGEPIDPAKVGRDAEQRVQIELTKARKELEDARADLLKKEQKWTEELIQARRHLTVLEEGLRRKEQELEEQRAVERASLETERSSLRDREKQLKEVKSIVNAGKEKENQQIERIYKAIDEANQRIRRLQANNADMDLQRAEQLLEPRTELIAAEEHLRLLERQHALQRDWARAETQAAEERIRQLEGRSVRADSAGRRLAELESKLDMLLSEMRELRKQTQGKK